MRTSFQNVADQKATRNFGGTKKGIAEPYVSGYHHIWFDNLPEIVNVADKTTAGSLTGNIDAILAASCLSVTPPGGTLNKISFTGLGGTKWAVPGSIDYGDSISIKFVEYSGMPICQIFHEWIKGIRDYRTGVSSKLIAGVNRDGYNKTKYASNLYYWTTAPDGITVEYYACYTGVFPLKDPQDLFSSDVENVGKIEPEIEFNVDYMWHEEWVLNKCIGLSTGDIKDALSRALRKDPTS
jgi:hypothetical protein